MHTLVAKNEHDDACTAKHCISHQKFAMQIIEQVHLDTHEVFSMLSIVKLTPLCLLLCFLQ